MLKLRFCVFAAVVAVAASCLPVAPARADGIENVYEQSVVPGANDAIKSTIDSERKKREAARRQAAAATPAPIRDSSGNIIVEIIRNSWTVNPASSWDKNYTANALEVLDRGGFVVLQLQLFQSKARVLGSWYDNRGGGFELRESTNPSMPGAFIGVLGPGYAGSTIPIEPLFVYPSRDHWGEFAPGANQGP